MNNPIIEVKNVFKGYRVTPSDVLVLKDVSLQINKGEFIVIFGPSGSGKSTLLNIVMGLEKPTKGKITFKGVEISTSTEDELAEFRKRNIGIVYQQSYWVKSLNVVENVALPLILRGIEKQTAEASALTLLNSLGMKEWATYHPHELSSGQQQKVSLARALITNPEIIIADEPTGNLDYRSGQLITSYLKKLAESGKTVIMVTHNLDNLDYAERVINIFDGRIADDFELNTSNLDEVKKALITEKAHGSVQDDYGVKKELDVLITEQTKLYEDINRDKGLGRVIKNLKHIITSIFLGVLLVIYKFIDTILGIRLMPSFVQGLRSQISNLFRGIVNSIDQNKESISYFDIFNLSLKTLFSKKNRTVVTIGGIAFGIGFTAFLISIGYGLEQLVISRSAQLEQLKQIEVYPPLGESITINDASIATIKSINQVEKVLPVINAAGKVNYQNSNIDVVVYGVQSDYLRLSDSVLVSGDYFKSNSNTKSDTPVSVPVSMPVVEDPSSSAERKAVVNIAFLNLIGLDSSSAVGKQFKLGYIPVNNLEGSSSSVLFNYDYEVSGVLSTDESPVIYTPIDEIKKAGINNYSQIRIVTSDQSQVFSIRQQLNVLGYRTTSVQDTIAQIEGFFSTARIIFAAVGLVALFVGSLGMFNTLTVSLLERTREVGLLKTMGMKSKEIREVFLSEAIIMGVYGGIVGIIIGIVGGYVVSLIISTISILRGYEGLIITYLPFTTAIGIILVSAFTGIATGFYPSRRATKISALDALRYE